MEFLDTYQQSVSRVTETLGKVFAPHSNSDTANKLIEVGEYALSASGKMLRGVMLLAACQAIGGNPEEVLYAAAGTEAAHLASLIHDDLIDKDELRRGKRTIWSAYGSDLAILAGDLFFFEAFHCLSLCRHTVPAERVARCLEVLSTAWIDISLGQALEENLIGNCLASRAEYERVVSLKTGSLFRAALEMGAILGGGTEGQVAILREYSKQLGIAFQMVDDLLPYMSDERTMGKPVTSDIRNHRVTLPILCAFRDGSEADRSILQAIFVEGQFDHALMAAHTMVNNILERTGAKASLVREVEQIQDQSLTHLLLLPAGEGREFLEMISGMALQRLQ